MESANQQPEAVILAIKSIKRNLIGSAIFQLLLGIIVFALGIVGKLIQTDVLYFPPFLILTMGYITVWQTIGIIIMALSISQIIFAIIYKKHVMSVKVKMILKFFIGFQCLNIPIGTFFGVFEWFTQKNMQNDIKSSHSAQPEHIKSDIGQILLFSAMILLGFLTMVYLLTIFLSTMMLDITYPYLTMGILIQLRIGLLIFGFILLGQIVVGIIYPKAANVKGVQILVRFLCILQIFYFPLGTYASSIILKELKRKMA